MATLSLKPNARKTTSLKIPEPTKSAWTSKSTGVMVHESGFSIQFFNDEECEIINIPKGMPFSTIRDMTTKAMNLRKVKAN